MRVKKFLKAEFLNGQTTFDWVFLASGLLLQVFAIVYGFVTGTPDNTASIISALAGIVSVVLCAQGKISFYVFAFIQLFTYVFGVAVPNHLYGELWENAFYFATMVYGVYVWAKRYKLGDDTKPAEIKAKKLGGLGIAISLVVLVVGTVLMTIVLKKTNDPVPFFDALTTVPAFMAQILLTFGYREQWVGWLIEDVTSVVMFIILGNWVMVAQYIFWTINCIYGWVKWSKSSKAIEV